MNRVLTWLDRLTARWWFGEAVVLTVCASILVLAVVMSPSTEALTLFGYEVPVLCGFRRLTGIGCPGCGLTRSFVFLGHGRILEAFQMNWFGPVLFVVVASQVPLRIGRLVQRMRHTALRTPGD